MKVLLTDQALLSTPWLCRTITPADTQALGQLMALAYRGTIDDAGETLDDALKEVQAMIGGKYGPLLAACSFLIEADGQAIAACLISLWQQAPLVADLITHPSWKNQGLGTFLLRKSMQALWSEGYKELYLFVTLGNAGAQHIYEKLGFVVVEQIGQQSRPLA